MYGSVNMPADLNESVRAAKSKPPSAGREPWPGNGPRAVPYVPSRISAFEPTIVGARSSGGTIHSLAPEGVGASSGHIVRPKLVSARHAPLVVSACALIVWLVLMLTVAARGGSLVQIALITMIPFLAHVVSVYLTVRSAHHRPIGALDH